MTNRQLGDLLRFDPLHTAERATGSRVNDDPETALLGMMLSSAHIDAKHAALAARRDTWSGMPFGEHLAVFANLGFEIVLDEPSGRDGAERFVVLWREDGVLGSCESYVGWNSTNSSHVNYCWRPHDPDGDWWGRLTSTGGGTGTGVWRGSHDTREGLGYTVASLAAEGQFVTPWVGRFPHAWEYLGTYAEWDNGAGRDRWDAVRQARFSRLPLSVRAAVGEASDV